MNLLAKDLAHLFYLIRRFHNVEKDPFSWLPGLRRTRGTMTKVHKPPSAVDGSEHAETTAPSDFSDRVFRDGDTPAELRDDVTIRLAQKPRAAEASGVQRNDGQRVQLGRPRQLVGEGGSNISKMTSARISDLDARSPSRKRSDDAPNAVFRNCSGPGIVNNGVTVIGPSECLQHIKRTEFCGRWDNCTGNVVVNGLNLIATDGGDADATQGIETLGMNGEWNNCHAVGDENHTESFGTSRVYNGGRILYVSSVRKG